MVNVTDLKTFFNSKTLKINLKYIFNSYRANPNTRFLNASLHLMRSILKNTFECTDVINCRCLYIRKIEPRLKTSDYERTLLVIKHTLDIKKFMKILT